MEEKKAIWVSVSTHHKLKVMAAEQGMKIYELIETLLAK